MEAGFPVPGSALGIFLVYRSIPLIFTQYSPKVPKNFLGNSLALAWQSMFPQ